MYDQTTVCGISLLVLVATTAGSSAAGVELPTDDFRQPAGITDENSFFLFFYGGRPFFWEKKFF
jgi:hypothetical protein